MTRRPGRRRGRRSPSSTTGRSSRVKASPGTSRSTRRPGSSSTSSAPKASFTETALGTSTATRESTSSRAPVGVKRPSNPRTGKWIWHPDWNLFLANVGHPVLVYDCNGDGLNDLIIGAAQDYGLKWVEQKKDSAGKRTFVEHWIEQDLSLFHTMELADLDGDGKMELVTGQDPVPAPGPGPRGIRPAVRLLVQDPGWKIRAAHSLV